MLVGEVFICTASRPGWSHQWKITVEDIEGNVFMPNGFPARPGAAPDPVTMRLDALLKSPQRFVDGTEIADLLQAMAHHSGASVESYTCPARMDLSDGHHGICTTVLGGQSLRVRVDVDHGAWRAAPDQAIFVKEAIERAAEQNGADLARSRGVPGVVLHVNCGKQPVVIADFPAKRTCDATFPSGAHKSVTVFVDGPRANTIYYWGEPGSAKR
jgi:hypothetical protein